MSTLSDGRTPVRVGVDLDNTLAFLDHLFQERAVQRGWLPAMPVLDKTGVRQALRTRPHGEHLWQQLQAEVYGPAMQQARLMDGAREFLQHCRQQGVAVHIVSHKTRHASAAPDSWDLRQAARDWLETQGFFAADGLAIPRDHLFFAATRSEKVARITALKLSHFVDDLPEVLTDAAFPANILRLWFNPGQQGALPGVISCADWWEIRRHVFP